jgi:DNA-binding transcriptional LysR family regulator
VTAPYDFAQARDAAASASRAQADAERHLKDAYRDFVSLAKEIVRRHAEDGVAWTVAPDMARGTPEVARLRRDRDISEGVREAMQQAAWRRAADRKDTQRFIDWSARRELAEGYGSAPEPDFTSPIGGQA